LTGPLGYSQRFRSAGWLAQPAIQPAVLLPVVLQLSAQLGLQLAVQPALKPAVAAPLPLFDGSCACAAKTFSAGAGDATGRTSDALRRGHRESFR